MRALIVNPNIERDIGFFQLGVASIASFVNAKGRHVAEVCDFPFHWSRWECYLVKHLKRFRPHVVGITTPTPRVPSAMKVARCVRRHLPDAVIVMGGHHASLETEAMLSPDIVDYVVIGEGEYTFHHLLDVLEEGPTPEKLASVQSLAWKNGDELIENQIRKLPAGKELDAIPYLDWTLWEQHQRMIYHTGYVPMLGVRGCAYNCSFCSSPIMRARMEGAGPFVRNRSAKATAREAAYQWETHRSHGLRYLFFYDQCFLGDMKWLTEFTDEYRRLGLHEKLRFSAYTRVDHITPESLDLVRRAGCHQLRMGIESADPYVRNVLLRKELDQDVLDEKMELLRNYDFTTLVYFIVGFPGESVEDALATFRFARDTGFDRAVFFYFTPLVNLPLSEGAPRMVDYLSIEESSAFYRGDDVTMDNASMRKFQVKLAFYRGNGFFLARTALRQLKAQGIRWPLRFPRYLLGSLRDDISIQESITQYVFYFGDSFLH